MRPAIRELLLTAYPQEAILWRQAVRTAGSDVSPFMMGNVTRLIRSLKASGVWATLDRLWLFAAENPTQALIDLKVRATATVVGAPTFAANKGYTGTGVNTDYLNSNFAPSSGSPNFVQNNAAIGCWVVTAPTTTAGIECGSETGAPFTEIGVRWTSVDYTYAVNSVSRSLPAHSNNWTGQFHAQRTGASALALYRNGASVNADTVASTTINTGTFSWLAHGTGGGDPSTAQLGMGWIGASLSTSQITALYAAQHAYMQAAAGVP